MAHETVTKSQRFYCVSLTPDICKTPVGNSVVPIPYNIKGEFKTAQQVSRDVKAHGEPVFLHGKSFIPSVSGDERGTLGGIKSGTFMKKVESKQYSSTKDANGKPTVQESRMVWMNNRNTVGRIMERQGQAPRPRIKILGWEVPESVQDAAQSYKDNYSAPLHQFGNDAMDVGGKIGMGSAAVGVAGAGVAATGVGLPVAAAMEVGAAAGGVTAGAVGGTGFVVDAAATAADMGAEFLTTGTVPNGLSAAVGVVGNAAENFVLKKIPGAGKLFDRLFKKKDVPGKTPAPPPKPAPAQKNDDDKADGGKTKQEKPKKEDKPASCCPKDKGPANKRASSPKPVHFGTGEEILYQSDFLVDGATPISWSRTYRSGSETEDWSMLGARWTLPFNSGVSECAAGLVFHDDTGRALRLEAIAVGDQFDHRGEGFVLRHDSDTQFTLTWRNGNVHVFQRCGERILPHGYQGVNAMLAPRAPLRARHFSLTRIILAEGGGLRIERSDDAQPGMPMLRIVTDEGLVVEALRAPLLPGEAAQGERRAAARVGRVEQVMADGKRICHVEYGYALDAQEAASAAACEAGVASAFQQLPQRVQLVRQTDISGNARSYSYAHGLLSAYTTYSGFAYGLEWISLACLRERWAGNSRDAAQLQALYPVTLENSYSARAVRTTSADGRGEVSIDYRDIDTTIVTEADGGRLEYRFDHHWLIKEVLRLDAAGKAVSLGRREWDRDGKLVADIDADGNVSRYTYDARGNLTSVTDALGYRTVLAYNAMNQLVSETDALGHTSTIGYDAKGRVAERRDALGATTRYGYDDQGRLSEVIDARGGRKTLAYDAAGRLTSYTDCSQRRTSYRYDSQGRLAAMVDPLGAQTLYGYNRRGELSTLALPDGGTESFDYDADGLLIAHVDARGQSTRYAFNGHGLPIERIDAKGQVVRYVHDSALRLIELRNGNDESYRFTYDAESRLLSETGFDGKLTRYVYDRAGRLVARDAAGVVTEYARDAIGQLSARIDAEGSVRYAYDPLGRVTAIKNPYAENHYLYDAVGQLVGERVAYGLAAVVPGGQWRPDLSFAMTHDYDELGNRIETVLPNGRRVQTLRYGSGHWHGTLWRGQALVDIERDGLHRESLRLAGQGRQRLRARREYDPQSRLQAMVLQRGEQVLQDRRYRYDRGGNLSQVDDLHAGTTRYAYDPIGQLLSSLQPGLAETFAFDPAGNLLNPAADADSAAQQLREQPLPDQAPVRLPQVTHNLLRSYLEFGYQYDVQGNVVCKTVPDGASANDAGSLVLAYDLENRLVSSSRAGGRAGGGASYYYDGLGRRIAKRVGGDGPSARTSFFIWDGDSLCQEVRDDKTISYLYEPDSFVPLALIESDSTLAGAHAQTVHLPRVAAWQLPPAAGDAIMPLEAWHAEREWQAEAQFVQGWQARVDAGGEGGPDRIFHYGCDHLGTPLNLFDDAGNTVWSAQYRAWGRIARLKAAAVAQPLRFQGQYEDGETGLYYNRYRYYDPDCARYTTQDPIGLAGGRNLYQYVLAPTGFIDPLGLFAAANYVYGLGSRIESATATITPADINTGSATNATSRAWARKLGCPKDDAGHVIGNQLGGRGGKDYVFPQTLGINRGRFAQWESSIADQVKAGHTAQVKVDLIYTGTSTRPDKIVYSYTINGQTRTRTFDNPRNCP